MDTHAWSQRLSRYGNKLGFKITAYDLRHAFALMFLRNGGQSCDRLLSQAVTALQRTLGHVDLTMTKRYVALTQDDLREQHTDGIYGYNVVFSIETYGFEVFSVQERHVAQEIIDILSNINIFKLLKGNPLKDTSAFVL